MVSSGHLEAPLVEPLRHAELQVLGLRVLAQGRRAGPLRRRGAQAPVLPPVTLTTQ